jgi:uncharacterized protein with NAD-binding domain and iron-sulfur cluster
MLRAPQRPRATMTFSDRSRAGRYGRVTRVALDPLHRDRVGEVTVYQRGWRLGGKAASHRGVHDRIEEHGLHIWLGYYDNAFRLIRDCYAELDRPTTDPTSPIQTWRDAFAPAPLIGLEDLHEGDWPSSISRRPASSSTRSSIAIPRRASRRRLPSSLLVRWA